MAQEGLQNAIKHGAARNISVQLKGGVEGLVLSIEDDGAGFQMDGPSKRGLGLVSMRERAESLGGTLKINSAPGHGTCLEVRLPDFTQPQTNAESARAKSTAAE
jgi:signal transduction histidine kinase